MPQQHRPPPLTHHVVPRTDLRRRLRESAAPVTVLLAGPGWGKTTVLVDLASRRPTAWLTLAADHAALVELLPALVTALEGAGVQVPASVAGLAAQATGPQADDGHVAERIAGELADHLTGTADALLVFDEVDALPAGSPGLQLLDALLRRLPPGLQVALAARDAMPLDLSGLRARGELHEVDAAALRMSPEETAALLSHQLGRASPELTGPVHDLTGGWPGAVRLVAESLRDVEPDARAHMLAGRGRGRGAVNSYVATTVLDRLPEALMATVHATAELPAIDEALCEQLGLPDDALEELSARGLLEGPDARGRFTLTPIVGLAVARATRPTGPQMPDRHRLLQAHIDLDRPGQALSVALAWHDVDAAAGILATHGAALLARGEVATLTAAAALVPADRRSSAVEEVLGQALMVRGEWTAALQCLHRAAQGADPLPVRVAWRLGLIHYLRGETAAALAVYDSAAEADPDDYQAALLLAFEACARWVGGQLDVAREVAARALAVAQRFDEAHALSAVHTALAMVAAADGDRVRSERHFNDGLAYAQSSGSTLQEVRLRSNHASHLVDEGRYQEALSELDEAGHLAELTGFAILRLLIGTNTADVQRRLGDLDAAEAGAREAEELGRALGTGLVLHPQLSQAEIHRDRGDVDQALRLYSYVIERAEEMNDHQVLVPALAGAARVTRDVDAAQALADRALERADGVWRMPARLAAGWVAQRAGDQVGAGTHARWVLQEAQRSRSASTEAEALELLAAAGPADERGTTLHSALRLWVQLGAQLDQLRVRAALESLEPNAQLVAPTSAGIRFARGVSRRVVDVAGLDQAVAAWVGDVLEDETPVKVAIRTFGGFSVRRPDGEVPASEWRSRKARDLLRILVARRGAHTSRALLADMLWPDEDTEKVSNRLSAAMSVVRSILDPGKEHPTDHYVDSTPTAIWLRRPHLDIDLERFHAALRDAASMGSHPHAPTFGPHPGAEAALEAATRLYSGEFMADEPSEEWALPTREEARAAYLGALRQLVRMASERGDHDAAISRSLRLLAEDPYDEDAYRHLIGVFTSAGRHGEAQRHYRRYVAQMRRLGVQPMPFPGVGGLRGIA